MLVQIALARIALEEIVDFAKKYRWDDAADAATVKTQDFNDDFLLIHTSIGVQYSMCCVK
jgi:hypothetical protein